MAPLRRAILAVLRKLGRTITLLIIVSVLSVLVLGGIAINRATVQAGVYARRQLTSTITVYYNMQGAIQRARSSGGSLRTLKQEPVTKAMVDKIASHPNVKAVNYIVNGFALASGFEPVSIGADEEKPNNNRGLNNRQRMVLQGLGAGQVSTLPDVTVNGVAGSELLDEFSTKSAILVDGKHITVNDAGKKVVLIEKNLAEQNKLKIGDTLTLQPLSGDTSLKYTVIGIYELQGRAAASGATGRNASFNQPYNRLYVDYKSALALRPLVQDASSDADMDMAVFYIDDPVNVDTVRKYISELPYDWNTFAIDANDRAYQQMMRPINQVGRIVNTMLWVVIIAGSLMLGLVLMLSMRERTYETGVLLSMGESKKKIVAQYLIEMLLISSVAFCFALSAGQWTARTIGNQLLAKQLQTVNASAPNADGSQIGTRAVRGTGANRAIQRLGNLMTGLGELRRVTPIKDLDIQVTAREAGQMALAELLIVCLATVVPSVTVMRFNPKQVLTRF